MGDKGRMEAALLAEVLDELRGTRATQTKALERLYSGVVNSVLLATLATLDSSGQYTADFHAPFGSVAVTNHGTSAVTVTNQAPAASAPTLGRGVHLVAAGRALTVNMAGTVLTLYGTAGQQVSLQVFTRPQPPAWGDAVAALAMLAASADGVAGAAAPEVALGAVNSVGLVDRLRMWIATNGGFTLSAAQPSSDAPAAVSQNNAAAVITFVAAGGALRNRLTAVYWSYSAAAAAGRLTVADGATTVIDQDLITAAAASGQLWLPPGGIRGTGNTAMTVTLAAGGVGNVGKLAAAAVVA